MFLHFTFAALGAVAGYSVPALLKKWRDHANALIQDVEKKL